MKTDNAGKNKMNQLTCRRNIPLAIIDDAPWLRVQRLYEKADECCKQLSRWFVD